MENYIFVSHSSKDDYLADKIAREMKKYNINLWIDHQNLKLGQSWVGSIENAMKSCKLAIFLLSNNSVDSEMCMGEYTKLMDYGKKTLIILTGTPNIPFLMRTSHYINIDISFEKAINNLAKTVLENNFPMEVASQDDINHKIVDTLTPLKIYTKPPPLIKYNNGYYKSINDSFKKVIIKSINEHGLLSTLKVLPSLYIYKKSLDIISEIHNIREHNLNIYGVVEIIFDYSVDYFKEKIAHNFKDFISNLLCLPQRFINILSIIPGSTIIYLEIPRETSLLLIDFFNYKSNFFEKFKVLSMEYLDIEDQTKFYTNYKSPRLFNKKIKNTDDKFEYIPTNHHLNLSIWHSHYPYSRVTSSPTDSLNIKNL